jgi:flagellar biosynthesis protein FlhF
MRIKRYEAPTIQEALMKVKKDLGPEAVILYTKTFRKGGVLGLFGKPVAEITAGVELNLMDDMSKRKTASGITPPILERNEIPISHTTSFSSGRSLGTMDPARTKVKALQRELNEMKTSSVASLIKEIQKPDTGAILSEGFNRLKKKLAKQEVEDFFIQKIVKGMIQEKIDPDHSEEVYSWLHRLVASCLKIAPPLQLNGYQKVIAFVGPTGVGKTTTLAKLAARFSLVEGKKVAMITSDTYRIAATEQLRTYGRIMGIPVEVANGVEDIAPIINRHKGMDLVLLDTAGRSPSNEEQMEELKLFISKSQADEIHIVLSATTKYLDMIRIIERFGMAVPINRMIFTKLDETRYYGALLNLMNNFQIPLAYCSIGQNVPDDLELPETMGFADKVTKVLLG